MSSIPSQIKRTLAPEFERTVAGLLIREPWAVLDSDAGSRLDETHFADPLCKTVFRGARTASEEGKAWDLVVASDYARGHLNGASAAVAELSQSSGTLAQIEAYFEVLEDARLRRMLAQACDEIRGRCDSIEQDGDALTDEAEQRILSIREGFGRAEWCNIFSETKVDELLANLEQEWKGERKPGLDVGLPYLNGILGGLQPGRVYVIAGRTSTGKSALAAQILGHVAIELGNPVAIFSIEMPAAELGRRFLARFSGVDLGRFSERTANNGDFVRVRKALSQMKGNRLHVRDSRLTLPQFRANTRRLVRSQGVRAVAIDYLQIMHGSRGLERRLQIAEITAGVKTLARELDIPIILVSQVNRESAGKEAPPNLHNLSESTSIEQDADCVAMLHRPDLSVQDCTIYVRKNRGGKLGQVDTHFDGQTMTFSETEFAT